MTRAEKLSYARGYQRGRNWPLHKPPEPPEEVVAELMRALRILRDECDAVCATFGEDDELVVRISPFIDRADRALSLVGEYLMRHEDEHAGA